MVAERETTGGWKEEMDLVFQFVDSALLKAITDIKIVWTTESWAHRPNVQVAELH